MPAHRKHQKEGLRSQPIKWNEVDWTKHGRTIAAELGLSYDWLRKKRRRLGVPSPDHKLYVAAWKGRRRHTPVRDAARERRIARALALARKAGPLTAAKAAKLIGFRVLRKDPIYQALKKNGLLLERQTHPWHLMNMDLSTKTLAIIWNIPKATIASRRGLKRLGKPLWDTSPNGLRHLRRSAEYYRYLAAAELEIRKANDYEEKRTGKRPLRNPEIPK